MFLLTSLIVSANVALASRRRPPAPPAAHAVAPPPPAGLTLTNPGEIFVLPEVCPDEDEKFCDHDATHCTHDSSHGEELRERCPCLCSTQPSGTLETCVDVDPECDHDADHCLHETSHGVWLRDNCPCLCDWEEIPDIPVTAAPPLEPEAPSGAGTCYGSGWGADENGVPDGLEITSCSPNTAANGIGPTIGCYVGEPGMDGINAWTLGVDSMCADAAGEPLGCCNGICGAACPPAAGAASCPDVDPECDHNAEHCSHDSGHGLWLRDNCPCLCASIPTVSSGGFCEDVHQECQDHQDDEDHCEDETSHGLWLRDNCPCLCGGGTTPAPTDSPTDSPTLAPTEMPLPMGPPMEDAGCSNAAAIVLPPGDLTDVADAETCAAMCETNPECDAATFTSGWIPWAADTHIEGGWTEVVSTSAIQALLETTCKISTCSDCTAGECKAAGTFGCPADEACVSVGPAGAGCGSTVDHHQGEECDVNDQVEFNNADDFTDYDTIPQTGISEFHSDGTLFMDTQSSTCDGTPGAQCQISSAKSCYGPYQDSDSFDALAGDVLTWEYKANMGGDWFEVMVVILRDGEPVAIPTFRFGNAMDFRTDSYTVTQSGIHTIRFIVGSYDETGGTILGASMTVKSFNRFDEDGNGYDICRLLGEGCSQVPQEGSQLSVRGGGGGETRRRSEKKFIRDVQNAPRSKTLAARLKASQEQPRSFRKPVRN